MVRLIPRKARITSHCVLGKVFQTVKVMGIPAPNSVVGWQLQISLEIFCNGIISSGKAKKYVSSLSLSLGEGVFLFFLVDQMATLCLEYPSLISRDISHLYPSPHVPRIGVQS